LGLLGAGHVPAVQEAGAAIVCLRCALRRAVPSNT
jgi:hypothetical protein